MLTLKNWSMFTEGDNEFTSPELWTCHLQGNVYGHSNFYDGEFVHTSRIIDVVDKEDHKEVRTISGSVYWLYKEDVDPECEKMYPNYYERFKRKRRTSNE